MERETMATSKRKRTTNGEGAEVGAARSSADNETSARRESPRSENGSGNEEQIRTRAYELYLGRAGAPGDEVEDWLRAEREYRDRSGERSGARSGGQSSRGRGGADQPPTSNA